MRVGIVCESARRRDGVGLYASWLAESLRAEQHEVVEFRPGWPESGSAPWAWLSLRGNGSTFEVPIGHPRLCPEESLDVLHVQAPYSPWTASLLGRVSDRTAVVVTFHSAPRGALTAIALRVVAGLGGRSRKRIDAVIAVSPSALQGAQAAGYRVSAVVGPVVPPSRSLSGQPEACSRDPGRVLFVGRLTRRKGAVPLLHEFARLAPESDAWRLRIAGAGPQAALVKRTIARLDLEGSVQVLGALDDAALASEMARAQVVCAPSLYGESFGMVLLEAMAAGAVVAGGANDGHLHVLGGAQVADVRRTGAYAAMLRRLLTNSASRRACHALQASVLSRQRAQLAELLDVYTTARARRSSLQRRGD